MRERLQRLELAAEEGGALVVVRGSGFSRKASDLRTLRCRFGSVAVAASFRTSNELACVAPARAAGLVALEVSNNGKDFSKDGVGFTYVAVSLSALEPPLGPLAGGTTVLLRGAGFSAGERQCQTVS